MKEFSIKQIESFTGIKAHTLRMWEQRYNFFKSKRKESNIRIFTNKDLSTLMKVIYLNNLGYKLCEIDSICEETRNQVIDQSVLSENLHLATQRLVLLTIEMKIFEFEQALDEMIRQDGFITVVEEVIWPFLSKIGVLWSTNLITPRHEHLVSNIIRRKLIAEIDKHSPAEFQNSNKIGLFCLDDEHHDLPLLLAQYILVKENYQVYYFGTNLPVEELDAIQQSLRLNTVLVHMTCASCVKKNLENQAVELIRTFNQVPIYISGQGFDTLSSGTQKQLNQIACVKDIKKIINTL